MESSRYRVGGILESAERVFQRSGGRDPTSGSSPSTADSTPTALPGSSATTGTPSPEVRGRSSTGLRPSGTAAAVWREGRALARLDPETTDLELLSCLPPSVASALKESVREIIDEQYGWDYEITGYSLLDDPPPADLHSAQAILADACLPASDDVLRRELTRLRVSTKARDMDADEIALTLQVIAEEAVEFPADVAVAALRRWAKREIFFPSLAEIRDEMQRLGKRRLALEAALMRNRR